MRGRQKKPQGEIIYSRERERENKRKTKTVGEKQKKRPSILVRQKKRVREKIERNTEGRWRNGLQLREDVRERQRERE